MLKLHSVTFALVDFSLQQTILLSPMALPKHGPLRFSVVTSLYFNSPFIPWTYLQAKRMQITIMQITIKRMQIQLKMCGAAPRHQFDVHSPLFPNTSRAVIKNIPKNFLPNTTSFIWPKQGDRLVPIQWLYFCASKKIFMETVHRARVPTYYSTSWLLSKNHKAFFSR